jgi:NAD(P)-dependent dehydrogenase (short-subunit alcohol dehydrogenase family)
MNNGLPTRVAIVTGAGRGIGRAHALELSRQGAAVVVNDLGGRSDGSGADPSPADVVVAEIRANGGQAVADANDVSDWAGAEAVVRTALDNFGRLDVLVNNAGIVRDRTIVKMDVEEWDAVVKVHLRGTFATTHFAAQHWRARAKDSNGGGVDGRLINTSSASGLYGNFGQANYAAAKAGIAAFTMVAAAELASIGVTANVVAPGARTRLTAELMDAAGMTDDLAPEHVARVVAWLASPDAGSVTGRVFDVVGRRVGVSEGWHLGPRATADSGWTVEELGEVIPDLVAAAAPLVGMDGEPRAHG